MKNIIVTENNINFNHFLRTAEVVDMLDLDNDQLRTGVLELIKEKFGPEMLKQAKEQLEKNKPDENITGKKCYFVHNCPDIENLDIVALIKTEIEKENRNRKEKKEFNKSYPIIICLDENTTNIKNVLGSFSKDGQYDVNDQLIFFKVDGHFSLPKTAKGQVMAKAISYELTANNVIGSPYDDALIGSQQARDHLYGGNGNDEYVYVGKNWGKDAIIDDFGDNKITFVNTNIPSSFILKKEKNDLVIKAHANDTNDEIKIINFFNNINEGQFSFEHQMTGVRKKYVFAEYRDGTYKLDLVSK